MLHGLTPSINRMSNPSKPDETPQHAPGTPRPLVLEKSRPRSERMAADKIECNACPVLCQITEGNVGACDRYANHGGALVRLDPVVILQRQALGQAAPLPRPAERCQKRRGERRRLAAPRGGGERGVVDVDPLGDEFVAEVAHGGEKQRDPGLVAPDVLALVGHLRHPHPVAGPVEAVEGRRATVELVAEDEDEGSHGGRPDRGGGGRGAW